MYINGLPFREICPLDDWGSVPAYVPILGDLKRSWSLCVQGHERDCAQKRLCGLAEMTIEPREAR